MIVENSSEKAYSQSLPVSNDKNKNGNAAANSNNKFRYIKKSLTREIEEKIKAEMRLLPSKYFKRNSSYVILLDRLLAELRTMPNTQKDIWSIPNNNVINKSNKI